MLVYLSVQISYGTENYTPNTQVDLTEPWRWSVLEELVNYESYCADHDTNGTIWFGNASGVISYDGLEYREYPFPLADTTALFAKNVFCASDGSVYLVTSKQIALMDPDRNWTLLQEIDSSETKSPTIAESSNGQIWIIAGNQLHALGKNKANLQRVEGIPYLHETILIDKQDRIWLRELTQCKLLLYPPILLEGNQLGDPVAEITIDPKDIKTSSLLFDDPDGGVWVLTPWAKHYAQKFDLDLNRTVIPNPPELNRRSNLSFISLDSGQKLLLRPPELLSYKEGVWSSFDIGDYSIPSNTPYLIHLPDDRLLLGANIEQSYLIDASDRHWKTYNDISFQCEDHSGKRWFLSIDNRIVSHDPKNDLWTALDASDGVIDSPNKITLSSDGALWVSGRHGKTAAISRLVSGNWIRDTFPALGYTTSYLGVTETQSGSIIFGDGSEKPLLEGSSGGIIVYRKADSQYVASHLPPPLYPTRVATLAEQKGKGLWLGSDKLSRSDPASSLGGQIVDHNLPDTWIDHLIVDKKNNLWVSKWGDGLYRYDGEEWKLYRIKDGIASNQTVFALPSQVDDTVWLATRSGISRFDGTSWTRQALEDGFEFHRESGTLAETKNGDLWINQSPRLWVMNRERPVPAQGVTFRTIRYRKDTQPPHVLINSSDTLLQEPANAQFSWKGIDHWYDTPTQNLEYSYRISNGDWSPFQRDNYTSALDLSAGKHTFEVRARDRAHNIEPIPASIDFTVIPPTWKRPWFIISVFLISAAIVSLIALVIRMRMKHLIALEEFKLDFFTNLSHELRTPLAAILGPLERMASTVNSNGQKETLNMVLRNAQKMLDLVNQLLEFRKIELGKLKYRPVKGEVVGFIKDVIYSLSPLWEKKDHSLAINSNLRSYRCGFDPDKLHSIVSNIVSNAIKYTPNGGTIIVSIQVDTDQNGKAYLEIQVKDNGIGIPDAQLRNVTDPFYRADSDLSERESSGIGLALISGLVDIWGGITKIESETDGPQHGTLITVRLPLNLFKGSLPQTTGEISIADSQEDPLLTKQNSKVSKPKILIVEDNPDILKFLKDEISLSYKVCTATNGIEGLDQIKEKHPDLIITDVMMPEMDGIELCRTIRENRETSHLPVIILTARTADEHYIEGIETGADEYFSKPIRSDLLIARIKNLLDSREKLRKRFAAQVVVEPQEIAVVSSDKQLLEKAIKTAESNLQTEGYDVEAFAKDLAMSHITLYRKLKAITGLTAVDFMRSIRLKRAAQLLRASDLTVGEILIQVGYYDASSFSRAFKKEFGKTPTQYRESQNISAPSLGN